MKLVRRRVNRRLNRGWIEIEIASVVDPFDQPPVLFIEVLLRDAAHRLNGKLVNAGLVNVDQTATRSVYCFFRDPFNHVHAAFTAARNDPAILFLY
jgi:hypothetical protein